jgi:hypothetical protein
MWISEGLEVKFEFTSLVVDNVMTMWVMAKPCPNLADDLSK